MNNEKRQKTILIVCVVNAVLNAIFIGTVLAFYVNIKYGL